MADVLSDDFISAAMDAVKYRRHDCEVYLGLALARIESDAAEITRLQTENGPVQSSMLLPSLARQA